MALSARSVVGFSIILLAVGLLSLLGIVGMTVWLGERSQVYFNEVTSARDARSAAVELRDAARTAEASQRGYLLTGNEIYLAPYDNAKLLSFRQLNALNRNIGKSEATKTLLQRLTATLTEKFAEMDHTISLKSSRRDAEAFAIFNTNRGKALMDEANVFLSGIIQASDDRLTDIVEEQRANAGLLRWVSIIGTVVIILVAAGAIFTVTRYAIEISQARDEVRTLNTELEERVNRRTNDLERARDRAEVLLAEVNHRVANSLTLVASLVQFQSNSVTDQVAKNSLAETRARIYAISLVHRRLYGTGDARRVALEEYLSGLLDHLETSMRAEGHGASLRYSLEPLTLSTDASINLGVVVTEWVTNAFKYAYPDQTGEIRVVLKKVSDERAELTVEDDGVGRGDGAPKGTGVGTRIVHAMSTSLGAEIAYTAREPGTQARISFPLQNG